MIDIKLDMLLTTGEQVSVALMAMALQFLNVPGEVIRKADEILSEIPN